MENYSSEAATARLAAVSAIRARVGQIVGSWLRDDECVQIALASATRANAELMEFMFNAQVARSAAKEAKILAVTAAEWDALFGWKARPMRSTLLESVLAENTFTQCTAKLQNSLRTTVSESSQGQIWARGWSKAACVLAVHVENHDDFISTCLGNLVRGDLRRLEDMRTELDDDGLEVMMMAGVVAALSESVT